jgi:hypothetical protein
MTSTTNGVVVDKPWYLSKKVWLCVIALDVALLQAITGRWQSVSPDQLAARIAEAATFLIPLVGTILAIAHVDAHTRAAALIGDALKTAASLDDAAPPDDSRPL